MKRYFCIGFIFVTFTLFGQDVPELVNVSGEYTVQWYQERESKKQAEDRAEMFARVNALERAFGTVIIQGNSTYIRNVDTGKDIETTTTFNMIGNTVVGGEIVEVKRKRVKENSKSYKRDRERVTDIFITCIIEGTARRLNDAAVDFSAFTLAAPSVKAPTNTYYHNDDVYIYFKSPVSGYVSVYVDITGLGFTQKILPYQNVPSEFENGLPVEADREYIFFSRASEHDYYADKYVIPDEIIAACTDEHEHWRFFVIFTKEPLNKPALAEGDAQNQLTPAELANKYSVPKSLSSEDFQRWMINHMSFRNDFQRKIIDVSVQKR